MDTEKALADDPAGEVKDKRTEALEALGKLSESMFTLRTQIAIPGTEPPSKRRRTSDSDVNDETYWMDSAADDLALVDA